MDPHFFTAPFYFDLVQGSRLSWQLCRLFLEDGILVSQPSPLGEGAPKGRIGHRRYEKGTANKMRKRRGVYIAAIPVLEVRH